MIEMLKGFSFRRRAAAWAIKLAICILQFATGHSAQACEGVKLTILYSRRNCAHCEQFIKDWNDDEDFRIAISTEFCVILRETGQYPLPRFRVLGSEKVGYQGKRDLWAWLLQMKGGETGNRNQGTGASTTSPPAEPPTPAQPSVFQGVTSAQVDASITRLEASLRIEREKLQAELRQELESLRTETIRHIKEADERFLGLDEHLAALQAKTAQAAEHDCCDELRDAIASMRGDIVHIQQQFNAVQSTQIKTTEIVRTLQQRSENKQFSREPSADQLLNSSTDQLPSPSVASGDRPPDLHGDDHRPAGGSQTAAPPVEPSPEIDLAPLLERIGALEQRVNQPLRVELFDSGKPTGAVKDVIPNGGYLPLDIHGEERVLGHQTP